PRSPRSGAGAPAPPMSCASGRVETSSPTAPRRSTSRRAPSGATPPRPAARRSASGRPPSAPTSPRRAARVTCCPRLSSTTSRRTDCTPNPATPPDDGSSQAPEGRARGARGHQGARDRGLRRDPSHFDVRSRDHRERGLRAPAEGAGEPRPGKSESRGRPRLRRGGGGRRRLGAGRSGRHRPAHHAARGALALQSRGAVGPAEAPKAARPAEGGLGPRQVKLFVVAVGTRMPGWVNEAFDEYAKRMPRDLRIELVEIRPAPRAGGKTTGQMLAAEAERIGRAVPRGCLRVALDERAREFTTAELARWLAAQREGGRDIAFLIG